MFVFRVVDDIQPYDYHPEPCYQFRVIYTIPPLGLQCQKHFILDPTTIVKSLAEQGITTVNQLPEGQLDQLIAVISAEKNLSIIPTSAYEAKRALPEQALSEVENAA
ncbi:hypothetical protein BDQ12DRAFT_714754 [Crucibulum laeve]|uniref:Uncharacterized protein n=1 Tax=Crucibulum laeve TaxID=68775 RepID=A0A5C3LQF7_9AGAR|nr:hypothetical protein BDQ12DRAFT_714754 [Crucibulum laeve]